MIPGHKPGTGAALSVIQGDKTGRDFSWDCSTGFSEVFLSLSKNRRRFNRGAGEGNYSVTLMSPFSCSLSSCSLIMTWIRLEFCCQVIF